jgi:taurine dioxygenase
MPPVTRRTVLVAASLVAAPAVVGYRHRWRRGDLVFWDNRGTIHIATGTPPADRRTLHRTTVRGPVPTPFG